MIDNNGYLFAKNMKKNKTINENSQVKE